MTCERRGATPVRVFKATLYNDEAMGEPLLSRVCAIVERAGYVYADDAERRPYLGGSPGSYVCNEIDVDGRTGTRTYDFRVFEDPARPVIELVAAAISRWDREPDTKIQTVGELCKRLRDDPARALGARSPQTLHSYLLGYAAALKHHGTAQLVDELGGTFRDWVSAQTTLSAEHGSRLNAQSAFGPESIALLASEDEHCAFEAWLDLRARCLHEVKASPAPMPYQSVPGNHSLFSLLAMIRKRPGMYFGDSRVEHLWALINGYSDAESEHGTVSLETAKMKGFQPWVDERYPFGRGHPWFRVFRLLAIAPGRGCEVFFDELDLFNAGDPPDAPDPGMTKMLDAILEHSQRSSDSKRTGSRPRVTRRSRSLRVRKRRRRSRYDRSSARVRRASS